MTTSTISVIVPVYKVEHYLERCLDSIIGQSWADWELILVDDCSPDQSPAICDRYAARDERIRVVHLPRNLGLSGARNAGLALASGEYISFIDSDDWIDPRFFQSLWEQLMASDSDIAASAVISVDSEVHSERILAGQPIIYSQSQALENILTSNGQIRQVACNKLYRRELFERQPAIGYPEGKVHEDVLTTYKLISRAKQVVYVPTVAYYYFQTQTSITRGAFNWRRLDVWPDLEAVATELKNQHPHLSEAVDYFSFSIKLDMVNAMIAGGCSIAEVAPVIRQLRKGAYLQNNDQATTKDRLAWTLLRWPTFYVMTKRMLSGLS